MTPSDADKIPLPLRESSQWVAWRLGTRNGKPTKEPIDPATGRLAAVNQPRTRGSFDAARSAVSRFRLSGVGYVFTAGDPYVGIDLDKCRDSESGVIEPWAQEIIDQLQSYTEVSQSGTGVHIIVRGALPPDVRGGRRCDRIECYSHSRYFIMTGAHLDGTPTTIEERTIELAAFYQAHFNTGPRSTVSLSQDDAALIEEAMLAANGKKFDQSWRGDWQAGGYPSQSEADLALCERLAFLTGKHHARIDRLFRKSGLMRPKWDEKHYSDGRTYGEGTIDAALRLCTESVGRSPPP